MTNLPKGTDVEKSEKKGKVRQVEVGGRMGITDM